MIEPDQLNWTRPDRFVRTMTEVMPDGSRRHTEVWVRQGMFVYGPSYTDPPPQKMELPHDPED